MSCNLVLVVLKYAQVHFENHTKQNLRRKYKQERTYSLCRTSYSQFIKQNFADTYGFINNNYILQSFFYRLWLHNSKTKYYIF